MICPKIKARPLPKNANCRLPVDLRRAKTVKRLCLLISNWDGEVPDIKNSDRKVIASLFQGCHLAIFLLQEN